MVGAMTNSRMIKKRFGKEISRDNSVAMRPGPKSDTGKEYISRSESRHDCSRLSAGGSARLGSCGSGMPGATKKRLDDSLFGNGHRRLPCCCAEVQHVFLCLWHPHDPVGCVACPAKRHMCFRQMANPGPKRPGHPGMAMEVRHSLNSPEHTQSLKVVPGPTIVRGHIRGWLCRNHCRRYGRCVVCECREIPGRLSCPVTRTVVFVPRSFLLLTL